MIKQAEKLCKEWHEAGREDFEKSHPSLNYDTYAPKKAIEKRKYINLDEGTSGAFLVDKTDGCIYRIKSKYGVPNRKKPIGYIDQVTGEMLNRWRWY